jgi:hypothetical protein
MDAIEDETTVISEIVRDAGCCGGGGIKRQYSYLALQEADEPNSNEVVRQVIEDTEDSEGKPYSRRKRAPEPCRERY